jgi:predicted deacylase
MTTSPPPPYTPFPTHSATTPPHLSHRITRLTKSCTALRDATADAVSDLHSQNKSLERQLATLATALAEVVEQARSLEMYVEIRLEAVQVRERWVEGVVAEMAGKLRAVERRLSRVEGGGGGRWL